LLGVSNVKDAQRLMQQLRLCCMDGVHSFCSALKLAHLFLFFLTGSSIPQNKAT